MRKKTKPVTPVKFMNDLWAARLSLTLMAAIDLDVFTIISKGNKSVQSIAKALNAPHRFVERLLDALVGMGYVTKRGSQLGLTPVSGTFLVATKPTFIGAMADESRITLPGWMKLAEVVRTGNPIEQVDTAQGREFFPRLVRAIFPMSYHAASTLVSALPTAKLKKVRRILDVAAGSGAWSLPFAQALPDARVTAMDYPEVTAVTRQYAAELGVADRYDYLEGDLRQVDFGREQYDVVILGHIIHTEGEKWGKVLISKSYNAIKPGGMLVIAEMIPNDSRTGPVFPLLFGLNMLLHTKEGDVFTMAQYKQWLKQAGFKNVKTIEADSPSPLIVATR